jgi:putative membrane protein
MSVLTPQPISRPARGPLLVWLLLGMVVLAQISYPLAGEPLRARLVMGTVLLGFAGSVSHALLTRGPRVALALVAVSAGGGLAVEACGVRTGFPFGGYGYSGALGPRLGGVPLVIPLAWTWMAWPAWLAAIRITRRPIAVAALGLASWDLFLDPQMVAEGYWRWDDPAPALPGVPDVPLTNYLGWLVVALAMMAALRLAAGPAARQPALHFVRAQGCGGRASDGPMYALYLWTYAGSVLAHAVFLDLPASAAWGGVAMGTVAIPLALRVRRSRRPAGSSAHVA